MCGRGCEEYGLQIAVTRRTTYRAEENVGNLEKSKKKQDLLIDTMNEEIKRLNEQCEGRLANLCNAVVLFCADPAGAKYSSRTIVCKDAILSLDVVGKPVKALLCDSNTTTCAPAALTSFTFSCNSRS